MKITITIEFKVKEIVYLISDPDQNKIQILSIVILDDDKIKYTVRLSDGQETDVWGFELSKTRDLT